MDDLTCAVCSEIYEGNVHVPVILPLCGHTFCRPCLYNLVDVNPFLKCPTCRRKQKGLSVTQLPTNFTVLTLASNQKHKQQKCEMCEYHGDPVRMWCRACQKPLCGQCLFEGHMTEGHSVIKIQVVLLERKQLIEDKAKRILRFIDEEKKNLGKEVHSIAHKLAGIYKKSRLLTRYAQDTEKILKDVRKTVRLRSVLANENKLESLSPLVGIRSSEDENTSKVQVNVKESPKASVVKLVGKDASAMPTPCTNTKKIHTHRSHCKVDQISLPLNDTENNNVQSEDLTNSNEVCMLLKHQISSSDFGADSNKIPVDESDTDLEDSQKSSQDGRRKYDSGSECRMWPLRRCAPNGIKFWPQINWQEFMTQVNEIFASINDSFSFQINYTFIIPLP
ncbi:hypothetical protein SK128_011583 [Halocaridina rubra]|uniref:Uncharacterized protein n=1 Tax=Halocaridina rubra TaxID=373956 RepID=A0AAN9A2Q3_HALRR